MSETDKLVAAQLAAGLLARRQKTATERYDVLADTAEAVGLYKTILASLEKNPPNKL
ncbi:hypothetical protein [Magnetospirillum molischianum]|uniref:hypothetical protein n=1 Tax=Magnetospirillum molischianum TaxID=1083 RepID=UPI0012DE00E6|nr:hypothetical protein [Magnetospirillum molischianum]